jgi:hypothetical protein
MLENTCNYRSTRRWSGVPKVKELAHDRATLDLFRRAIGIKPDSNGGWPMITSIQRRGICRGPLRERRQRKNEKSYFEVAGLERQTRPGPHRICFDGGFRSRSGWCDYAWRGQQHQHDLLEDRVRNDRRRFAGQLNIHIFAGWGEGYRSLPIRVRFPRSKSPLFSKFHTMLA